MAFTAVHIPEFPVAAWLRDNPDAPGNALRGRPLAILEGTPPHDRVVSLSPQARQAGVAAGMSKVQAEASGAILFHPRSAGQEQQAFAHLLELTERFTPRTEAIASPANAYAGARTLAASLLLDSTGTETLFGPPEHYARALHQALAPIFPARVASAPNAEAALLLARSYSGVTCADAHTLRAKLASLPVSALACGKDLLDTFRRWGIRTLGQLADLPEAALISRVGQHGRRLQQLATGTAGHLLVPEAEAFLLHETAVLDGPLTLLDSLLFILSPMLDRLLRQAMERAFALRSVTLTLELEKKAPHQTRVRPAVPTQSHSLLLKLLNLELQAHPPQAGIVSVTLTADPTQPQTAQRGLFQSQFPEPDRLDLLLARLRSIAGENNVGSPALEDSHRLDAFTLAPYRPHILPAAPETVQPARRALQRLRPAPSIRVLLHNDSPLRLFWRGTRLDIASAAGPWHSSGRWWDTLPWDVSEWDAAIAEPPLLLRLTHNRLTTEWSLTGLYD